MHSHKRAPLLPRPLSCLCAGRGVPLRLQPPLCHQRGRVPYKALTGATCGAPVGSVAPAGAITVAPQPGYATVAANPTAIMNAVSSTGPVVVYFNVQNSFYGYAGGIYQASSCTTETINHAMLLVGYNATAGVGSPDSYWIIRNSW